MRCGQAPPTSVGLTRGHGTRLVRLVERMLLLLAAARNRILTGGWAREVTTRELPLATDIAGSRHALKPGGIRELHWHKEASGRT